MSTSKQMTLYETYRYYLDQGDPRVKGWFLMDEPWEAVVILVSYWVSLVVIKRFMENRQAFELKNFLYLYNFSQVLVSFYMFVEVGTVAYLSGYKWICQPVDYSNHPLALRMLSVMWLGFFTKVIDLADTIVFALRKKNGQITFLHVYHHSTILAASYFGDKYVGGGNSFILLLLNSLVHTVMYAYYGLAALGPHMQPYLWWKMYLTQLQLFQFIAVMIHSFVSFLTPNCAFPRAFSLFYVIYGLTLLALFLNFYIQSYKGGKRAKGDKVVKKSD